MNSIVFNADVSSKDFLPDVYDVDGNVLNVPLWGLIDSFDEVSIQHPDWSLVGVKFGIHPGSLPDVDHASAVFWSEFVASGGFSQDMVRVASTLTPRGLVPVEHFVPIGFHLSKEFSNSSVVDVTYLYAASSVATRDRENKTIVYKPIRSQVGHVGLRLFTPWDGLVLSQVSNKMDRFKRQRRAFSSFDVAPLHDWLHDAITLVYDGSNGGTVLRCPASDVVFNVRFVQNFPGLFNAARAGLQQSSNEFSSHQNQQRMLAAFLLKTIDPSEVLNVIDALGDVVNVSVYE